MSKINRRDFLKLGGNSVAATSATGGLLVTPTAEAAADSGRTTLPYPANKIANAKSLSVNKPVSFTYPDKSSPCVC